MRRIGRVAEIRRYPVKSMAGETLPSALLGWHGLEGDRRFAFIRSGVRNGFPWLTASKLPSLLTYSPIRAAGAGASDPPQFVRTPSGKELELHGDALRDEVAREHGAAVELMHLKNGIFDDAPVSLITQQTVAAICASAGLPSDPHRFRPNLLINDDEGSPFVENGWVGKSLRIGESDQAPILSIAMRDVRCVMINLDPGTAVADSQVLKAAVAMNANCAGVYAMVVRGGSIDSGAPVFLD